MITTDTEYIALAMRLYSTYWMESNKRMMKVPMWHELPTKKKLVWIAVAKSAI